MKFICYEHWSEIPSGSKSLFEKAEKDSLFFSHQWFENLILTSLNSDQELLIACVIDENSGKECSVLAILPLIMNQNKEWSSLSHPYSSLYSFLLSETNQSKILNCLCSGLKRMPFDYLSLEPVDEKDEKLHRFEQTMEASGFSCHRPFRFYNWFHRTNGQSFSHYMDQRPSKVRNTIARKQRKLEREHGYDIQLHTDGKIEHALADYHALYKVSWKANEQHEAIIKGFVDKATKAGWTRLGILYVEDKPIAAHLWFVVHRKASIFRLVYDQGWKNYSPGSILMSYMMEYVIDTDAVNEIDFLTGNDKYKQDWMSERRKRQGITWVKKPVYKEKTNLLTRVAWQIKRLRKLLFSG